MTDVSSGTMIPIAAATPEKLLRFSMDQHADKPPVSLFFDQQPLMNKAWICWRATQEPKPVAFVVDDQTLRVTLQMEYA
jgi:hypothetical protein